MATGQMSEALHHLRTVVLRDGPGLTDGDLLRSFVGQRDAAALAALVHRHGPMVWGVCRRLLPHHHDAEDAFQATFLVLVRKAATIGRPELVANWLYGVAHQTAVRARAAAARRATRERQVPEMPEPPAAQRPIWDDLRPILDQELSRLPEKYRSLIVLCDLEGKTRQEVARQLGRPEGTVAGQLARARALLARRLGRHGLAVSGAILGSVLAAGAASAVAPATVVSSTIRAASQYAAGEATAAGVIPARVVALSEGVLRTMFISRLKMAIAFVLSAGAIAVGGGVLHRGAGAAPAVETATPAPADEPAGVPMQDRKDGRQPKDGTTVTGTLAGVDADKNTVTITIHAFDRKTGESTDTNKTFPLAKDATILQDETPAKLADLKKGYHVSVKLDQTTAVSVSVDGGTAQAEFRSANPERNTITVLAGRDTSRRVYHLLKTTKVIGDDGKPVRIEDLKPGTMILITLSVEDANTAVRIQTLPDRGKKER
jgi:RNA polymerase sigma factor (sigma-70 family)